MDINENEVNQEMNEAVETELEQDYPAVYEENEIVTTDDESDGVNPALVGIGIGALALGLGVAYKKLAPKIKVKAAKVKAKLAEKKAEKIKQYVAANPELEAEIINAKGERMAAEAAPEKPDVEITEVETEEK